MDKIRLDSIDSGGYRMSYSGRPDGARLILGVQDVQHSIDVTNRPSGDLLDAQNLPQFLACIGKQGLWGKKGTCRLFVMKGDSILTQSNPETFDSPVKPYVGRLVPSLGIGLKYTGIGTGRYLHIPSIDNCYYFAYGGRFESATLLSKINS